MPIIKCTITKKSNKKVTHIKSRVWVDQPPNLSYLKDTFKNIKKISPCTLELTEQSTGDIFIAKLSIKRTPTASNYVELNIL